MYSEDMKNKTTYSVGSLFAGIGGICQAFKDAGYNELWANEFDKNCHVTYRTNFKHRLDPNDIRILDPKDFPKVDVITSGFPCQAFSIAGYQRGFDDKRGNLFFETMKFINLLQPKVFLLENVKNLVSHDEGRTVKVIQEEIFKSGYSFTWRVLNSMDYGNIPQTRERVYMVGFKDEAGAEFSNMSAVGSNHFVWPKKIPLEKNIQDDILEEGRVHDKYYYKSDSRYYKIFKDGMKSRDTVYQWRRVYLRENKKGVCPTLTANMGMGGHNVPLVVDRYGMRKITPRECARLQGFRDSFVLPPIADSQLYKQFGNSVSIPVVKRIADAIRVALDSKHRGCAAQAVLKNERLNLVNV